MPEVSFPSNSKYLAQEDFDVNGTVVTIVNHKSEEMNDGVRKEVIYLDDYEKGMVLNQTNGNALIALFGSNTDNWENQQVVVYVDPTVSYGGKTVGGLRIRLMLPTDQHKKDFDDKLPDSM